MSRQRRENWLFITLGAQFATLTEFLDAWRVKQERRDGPITRVWAFATRFAGGRRNWAEEEKHLRERLAEDAPPLPREALTMVYLKDRNGKELEDIKTSEDAASSKATILQTIQDLNQKYRPSSDQGTSPPRFLYCLAGGRKTMSSDLMLASMLTRQEDDRVYHLFVNPEDNNRLYHLHPSPEPQPETGRPAPPPNPSTGPPSPNHAKARLASPARDFFLVEYPAPSLSGLFGSLVEAGVFPLTELDRFNEIIAPVTSAMAANAAQSFTLVGAIKDPGLRGTLIQLIASWSSASGQERLWGGDVYRYFVDHGFQHACSVLHHASSIHPLIRPRLSDVEVFALVAAIWLHDIGMSGDGGETPYLKIRKEHGQISQKLIDRMVERGGPEIDPRFRALAPVVGEIVSYHQKDRPLDEEQAASTGKNLPPIPVSRQVCLTLTDGKSRRHVIRTRLLAAVLQLCDACDVQEKRLMISAQEKQNRTRAEMDRVFRALIDRVSLLLGRRGARRRWPLAARFARAIGWQEPTFTATDEGLGKALSALDFLETADKSHQKQEDQRFLDLAKELRLMGDQYQNHYLLHHQSAQVIIKPPAIIVRPGPISGDPLRQAQYLRQIRQNITDDLDLTHGILEKAKVRVNHVRIERMTTREHEAKFALTPAQWTAAQRFFAVDAAWSDLAGCWPQRDKREEQQVEDLYFDTKDLDLFHQGKGIRFRTELIRGRTRRTLCYKGPKAKNHATAERPEWEVFVPATAWNRPRQALAELVRLLDGESLPAPHTLAPVLTLHNRRTFLPLVHVDQDLFQSKFGLYLDEVTVRQGSRQIVFHELEGENFFGAEETFQRMLKALRRHLPFLDPEERNKYRKARELVQAQPASPRRPPTRRPERRTP